MIDARTIAALVNGLPLDEAAALIQQYADAVAAERAVGAVQRAYDHVLASIEAPVPVRPS